MTPTLESRIARLERTNRRLFVAIGASLSGLVLMAAKPPPKVITAQQFLVRDSDGNAKAVLGVEVPGQKPGLTGLYFWRKDRTVGAAIDVNAKDDCNFQLSGKGDSSIAAVVTEAEGPFLQIEDAKGEIVFSKP